jgi:hypothetical protein
LRANQQQLGNLPNAISVFAHINNLNGTMDTGMLIKGSIIEALEDSPHVKDYEYTVESGAALGFIREEDVPDMESGRLNFPLCLGLWT